MKTIGSLLWLVLCGAWLSLGWLLWAVLLAITVIGLPFARQCLKLANFSLWPFGRTGVQAIKLAGLALAPFGKKVVRTSDLSVFSSPPS
jgi:uncharacterized membrane protein YccF (DUF307 family)